MGHADFRVNGKVFVTLGWPDELSGMVKLPPELQDALRGYGIGVFALLTRRVFRDGEVAAVRHGLRWLRRHHLPTFWRALDRKPEAVLLAPWTKQ